MLEQEAHGSPSLAKRHWDFDKPKGQQDSKDLTGLKKET